MMRFTTWILAALMMGGLAAAPADAKAARTFEGKRAILDEEPWWTKPDVADQTLQRIKSAGFNVYIPNVWHGRGSTWPSKVVPLDSWVTDWVKDGYDPLKDLIKKAHAAGIEVHPWFCVVLRQSDVHPEFALPGTTPWGDGAFDIHDPRFVKWIGDLVMDVVSKYDIDGINLDFVRAIMLCGTDSCAAQYRSTYGRSLAADSIVLKTWPAQVPTLVAFQEQAVTNLVKSITDRVRAVKPKILISVDATPDQIGAEQGQNSVFWTNEGMVDVLFRMDYYRQINEALTNSVRAELSHPDSLSIMISNVSNSEELAPGQAIFARDGKWLADTFAWIAARWPKTGIALYFTKYLTDDQISALQAYLLHPDPPVGVRVK